MVNGYGYHLPDRIIKPAKMVQTPTAGVLFLRVCRDSRVSGARGAAPCCGKAANVVQRGKQAAFSLCRQALGRAHTPARVYKCALCSKGIYSAFPASARFLKNSRAGSLVKASRRSAVASSSVMFFASGTMLSKTAPRTIRRWLRVLRSSLDSF